MKILVIAMFAILSLGAAATNKKPAKVQPSKAKSTQFKAANKSVKKAPSGPKKPAFLTLAADTSELVIPVPIPAGKTTHSCRPNRTVVADPVFKDLCGRSLQVQKVAKPGAPADDFKAAGYAPKAGAITTQEMPWGKLYTAREPASGGKILYRIEVKDKGPVFMMKDTFYHKIEFAKFQLGTRKPAAITNKPAQNLKKK